MAGCGCRGGSRTCACVVTGDGISAVVTGRGTTGAPYVISMLADDQNVLGTPTNMVTGQNTPRPALTQVWWYSTTGQVPAFFQQGTDVLLGPSGFLPTTVVGAPLNLTAGTPADGTVRVSWSPVAGASYYELAYRDTTADPSTATVVPTAGLFLDVSLSDLATGTQVQFQVRTVNPAGPGVYSAAVLLTVPTPGEGDFADADFSTADFA